MINFPKATFSVEIEKDREMLRIMKNLSCEKQSNFLSRVKLLKVLFSNILAFFVFGENYIKMLNSKLANTFHESEMKETEKGQLIVFEEK